MWSEWYVLLIRGPIDELQPLRVQILETSFLGEIVERIRPVCYIICASTELGQLPAENE